MLNGIEILCGYALEAAKSILVFGINGLKIDEIVAAVNFENLTSDKVLKKIGMQYIGEVEWPEQGMVKKYKYISS